MLTSQASTVCYVVYCVPLVCRCLQHWKALSNLTGAQRPLDGKTLPESTIMSVWSFSHSEFSGVIDWLAANVFWVDDATCRGISSLKIPLLQQQRASFLASGVNQRMTIKSKNIYSQNHIWLNLYLCSVYLSFWAAQHCTHTHTLRL